MEYVVSVVFLDPYLNRAAEVLDVIFPVSMKGLL